AAGPPVPRAWPRLHHRACPCPDRARPVAAVPARTAAPASVSTLRHTVSSGPPSNHPPRASRLRSAQTLRRWPSLNPWPGRGTGPAFGQLRQQRLRRGAVTSKGGDMRIRHASLFAIPLLAIAMAAPAQAQNRLSVTPLIGGYIPGNDIHDLRDGAEEVTVDKEAALGLGLNVEFGWLRGSLAYASGATVNVANVTDPTLEGEIGEGNVLAVAADVVFRP